MFSTQLSDSRNTDKGNMNAYFFSMHKHLILSGILCALAYLYLAIQSQSDSQASLSDLYWVCAINALITFALWNHYRRIDKAVPVALLLGFAVVFRLTGVVGAPVLEDDFYRYLWDGYMWVEQGSPYGVAPAAFFNASALNPTFEDILDSINHPEIPTIYGPVCQWVFALGYWLAPGQLWPIQLIFAAADIGIVLLLLRLTNSNNVLLYAWSPLIIKEFAFTAHPDVLGVFFLVSALVVLKSNYGYRAAVLLALATGVKIFALIAVPFLLRLNWRYWLTFFVTAACLSIPFGVKQAWLPEGLSAMAQGWLFNAPLYFALLPFFSLPTIKAILLTCFTGFWAFYLRRVLSTQRQHPTDSSYLFRGDWLFGLFLLALPVLNPWYLVWLLPFASLYPTRWAWAASVAALLAYATGLNLDNDQLAPYQQPMSLVVLEFGVVALALIAQSLGQRRIN